MSKKQTQNKILYKFYIDPDDLEALEKIKAARGVPVAFSIRQGIKTILAQEAALEDPHVVWFPNAPYQNKPQS